MRKQIKYFSILILFTSCERRISNLKDIIRDKRMITFVNEFVDNVKSKNDNNNVYITGTIGKNPNILEIGLYNQQPILYSEGDYLNSYIKSRKFGLFTYNGINFYVTNDLKGIFDLQYENFDKVINRFDKQEIAKPTDYYSMFINITKKDSTLIYYSNLSKESLKWKKIK